MPSPASRVQLALQQCQAQASAALWQGDQLATSPRPACPSGFAPLDAELPGGGWPASGLSELLPSAPGCGEITLLAPALARLAQPDMNTGARELVWVAPPWPPYAPALQALGLPLARVVWIDPAGPADAAWAAEQALRSGSAAAVLWWSGEKAPPNALRRLHLAAQEGATPLFALRPSAARTQSSPAPLRLALEPLADGQLRVDLFKRRGPALAAPVVLPLGTPRPRTAPASTPARDVVVGPVAALAAA